MLGEVLAAMSADVVASTLVVRLADHGEMGMSQGGMREKEEQVYNETLLVPMIFSNPGAAAGGQLSRAGRADRHPAHAGGDSRHRRPRQQLCGAGRSLASAIWSGDSGTTYHSFLFATDDATIPIRCLVEDQLHHAKYAVYYDKASRRREPQRQLLQLAMRAVPLLFRDPTSRDLEMTNQVPVNGLRTGEQASSAGHSRSGERCMSTSPEAITGTNTLPENWLLRRLRHRAATSPEASPPGAEEGFHRPRKGAASSMKSKSTTSLDRRSVSCWSGAFPGGHRIR